jgi:hypothetical protein
VRLIPLTQNKFSVVDDWDYYWLSQWKWHAHKNSRSNTYYAERRIGHRGPIIGMHRQIMGFPEGYLVDHIDQDGLNNQRTNLRNTTVAKNNMNRGIGRRNTSGFKGVTKSGNRWTASITVDRRTIYLGTFDTPFEASAAYNKGALQYHGEYASLNEGG